jgi:hypothetical protein
MNIGTIFLAILAFSIWYYASSPIESAVHEGEAQKIQFEAAANGIIDLDEIETVAGGE